MNKGTISQVIGPVVDVHFKDKLPMIFNALEVTIEDSDSTSSAASTFAKASADKKAASSPRQEKREHTLTLEVQQQLPGNVVRTIAMSSTDGLKRGTEAIDTGAAISVPVGKVTLG